MSPGRRSIGIRSGPIPSCTQRSQRGRRHRPRGSSPAICVRRRRPAVGSEHPAHPSLGAGLGGDACGIGDRRPRSCAGSMPYGTQSPFISGIGARSTARPSPSANQWPTAAPKLAMSVSSDPARMRDGRPVDMDIHEWGGARRPDLIQLVEDVVGGFVDVEPEPTHRQVLAGSLVDRLEVIRSPPIAKVGRAQPPAGRSAR